MSRSPAILTATLVRGSSFTMHNGRRFQHGQTVVVSAAERDYLEKHAIDLVNHPSSDIEGEVEQIPMRKFRFSTPSEEEATP